MAQSQPQRIVKFVQTTLPSFLRDTTHSSLKAVLMNQGNKCTNAELPTIQDDVILEISSVRNTAENTVIDRNIRIVKIPARGCNPEDLVETLNQKVDDAIREFETAFANRQLQSTRHRPDPSQPILTSSSLNDVNVAEMLSPNLDRINKGVEDDRENVVTSTPRPTTTSMPLVDIPLQCKTSTPSTNRMQVRPLKCPECDKLYKLANSLRKHRKLHMVNCLRCYFCDKKCSGNAELYRHLMTHTQEKGWKCEICSKEFAVKQLLRRHISDVHEEWRPFTCSVCFKAFSRKDHMLAHLKKCRNVL